MALEDAFDTYKVDQTPESLNSVVGELKPTITYALSNLGALNDPVIRSEAKVVAAKAIKHYDPSFGATLETHVSNSLRQLSRTARKQRSTIRLPERHQLDAYALYKGEKEYVDKYGKEPDLDQLSDFTGISRKRINKIKGSSFAIATEGSYEGNIEERPDYTQDAIEYIYTDADHKNKKILEHKLGYGGAQVLSNEEIAKKLNIHPSQVSRRSASILIKIDELISALEEVQ